MTEPYPSAPLLAQLEEALRLLDATVKVATAWRLVMQATANADAGTRGH